MKISTDGFTLQVRNTWAKEILRKGWGSHVRTRVALRKQLHRNPTNAEFLAALKADAIPLTQDDIRNAYDKGEEVGAPANITWPVH